MESQGDTRRNSLEIEKGDSRERKIRFYSEDDAKNLGGNLHSGHSDKKEPNRIVLAGDKIVDEAGEEDGDYGE